MVEAVGHGGFVVLGSSVNGGFIQQQYAPNHPSSHRIFPDFLSRLNHGAIQPANNEIMSARTTFTNPRILTGHTAATRSNGRSS